MRFATSLMLSAACIATGTAQRAFAQATPTQGTAPSGANNSAEASAPAAAEQAIGLEDIIVTANKRAESLQRVAAAVAAVSQDTLIRQGVKEITDITRVVPEVTIATGAFSNVTIRGVRTGAFGPSTDSPNAVHVDGAYLARFTGLQGIFFDAQRVEVLEGPQGTLYGRNSAGGTINVITNKPTMDDVHVIASLEYGNYSAFTANAAINLPISSNLAVRAAYFHNSHRGYANNGTDDSQQDSGRVSVLWRPTSTDSLLFTADREVQGGKGAALPQITEVVKQPGIRTNSSTTPCPAPQGSPPGTPGTFICTSTAADAVIVPIATGSPRDLYRTMGSQDAAQLSNKNTGLMAQYDHDFGWANLTAQVAYHSSITHNRGGTTIGFSGDPRLITTAVRRPAVPSFNDGNSYWNTQELRLTSPSNRPITYVLGLFHFHERAFDNHNGNYRVTYPNTSAATIGQIILADPLVVNQDIANPLNVADAYAAFGQVTYTPIEGLHITGGLRYNTEKKHGIGQEILNGAISPASLFDKRRTDSALTYKANISYEFTPRNLVYIDTSSGFKSGGFAYGSSAAYDPEKIKAYEIGTKNRFFHGMLQVNAAAWHYDYNNIVTTINEFFFDATLGRPNNVINTANGRRAKLDGQSISIELLPTRDDILSFNGTHNNARFTDYDIIARQSFALANGLAPGATPAFFDYSGTPIGNVADFVFNGTYDHIFHMFDGELDAQVAGHYTGERLFGNQAARADVNNYLIGKPYATGDASLRFQPSGSRWALTGYVRNFTNKDVHLVETYVSNFGFLPASDPRVTFAYRTVTFGTPRTYGLILSVKL